MQRNPIRFAVVREDPAVEREVMRGRVLERALLVASGGCTALSLQSWWPEAALTLVDPNPAQLELVQRKVDALRDLPAAEALRRFNVGSDDPAGLCQCGSFEGLFRTLRRFLHEFVAGPDEIERWFADGGDPHVLAPVFAHPYWRTAFELCFSDALLQTMFGTAATQHAPAGSFPSYFRARFERGLRAADARANRFLHHVFLGRYLPDALPEYLARPPAACHFTLREGPLAGVPELESYDLVDLSNVMDWMAAEECMPMVARLRREMRPGAVLVWRQLNNEIDRRAWFAGSFTFDERRDSALAAGERSLFYVRVHAGTKREQRA